MSVARSQRYEGGDGLPLVWHEIGDSGARPVLLLHGLFSNAETNWIKFGHAGLIASRGFRVIMPDLRGHGESAKPHDPASYPPDILAQDGSALVKALGLADYDLGGYSLGARTAARMVINGARPRRLVIAGMGLEGLLRTGGRSDHFRHILSNLGSFERGSPEWLAEAFLKTNRGDPEALLLLLGSFVASTEAELGYLTMPTLAVAGAQDRDNGSSEALAALLPEGRFLEVPGNHMSAVTRTELGGAIADFLIE